MWLIRKTARGQQGRSGTVPRLTSATSGEEYIVGAYESRQLPVCAPYGVYARPAQGQEAAVISAQSGAQLCLGSVTEGWPEGLQPGEILLRSAGGASIKLCSDGKILLNGREWKEE